MDPHVATKFVQNEDGWIVERDTYFLNYVLNNPAPRKWTIWNQISEDTNSKLILAWWIIGFASFVVAIWTGYWILIGLGLFLYIRWYWLCRITMTSIRNGHVRQGTIKGRRPHPFFSLASEVIVTMSDGRQIKGSVMAPLDAMIDMIDDPAFEVLIMDDGKSVYQTVFALREVLDAEQATI